MNKSKIKLLQKSLVRVIKAINYYNNGNKIKHQGINNNFERI